MKLKRILSLALAGVMAVSMLAGCSGGSSLPGSNKVKGVNSSTFIAAIESAAGDSVTLPEIKSNSSLAQAVKSAASTLTAAQVGASSNKVAPSSVLQMVRQITDTTEKTELDTPSAWSALEAEKNFTSVFIYDGKKELDDVAAEVAKTFTTINLTDKKATEGTGFTNAYKCYVSACEVTIEAASADEEDVTAWVVGIRIDRTTTKTAEASK